ncbi:hypothetical protein [Fredinandcohnia onubensis]|nr:hypothetical protein [Fredinandcohnia onubensis]
MSNEIKTPVTNDYKDSEGYKIIEVNLNNPTENLFAVVTPIKMQ